MKLRNKKTGEITEDMWYEYTDENIRIKGETKVYEYNSLAELNEDWEDYEEPKKDWFWFIDEEGSVRDVLYGDWPKESMELIKEIGNYFETKEEAEKAIEKLKAWKRLKDAGFRFTFTPGVGSLDIDPGKFQIDINAEMPERYFCNDSITKDLDLLFGDEK